MNIIMMVRVALGTWPGGLKLYRDPLLETDDHRMAHHLQEHLVTLGLEVQLPDERSSLF